MNDNYRKKMVGFFFQVQGDNEENKKGAQHTDKKDPVADTLLKLKKKKQEEEDRARAAALARAKNTEDLKQMEKRLRQEYAEKKRAERDKRELMDQFCEDLELRIEERLKKRKEFLAKQKDLLEQFKPTLSQVQLDDYSQRLTDGIDGIVKQAATNVECFIHHKSVCDSPRKQRGMRQWDAGEEHAQAIEDESEALTAAEREMLKADHELQKDLLYHNMKMLLRMWRAEFK